MTENQYTQIQEHATNLFALYRKEDYAAALESALEGVKRYPQARGYMLYFAASMSGCLGDQPQTMNYLHETLASGWWMSDTYLADSDFDSVRDTPEFQKFSEASVAAYRAATADVRSELHLVQPDKQTSRLLLALHGNNANVTEQLGNWRPATGHGWWVAMPQSTQVGGLNYLGEMGFVWNDWDAGCSEVLAHHTALAKGYGVDEVVMGGFSRGGEMAIQTTVTGAIASKRFIAVCPGGPLTMEPEKWQPIIAGGDMSGLRGVVILGGKDQLVEENKQVAQMLRDAGAKVEVEVHPDMGHAFPDDFGKRLPGFLEFVTGA